MAALQRAAIFWKTRIRFADHSLAAKIHEVGEFIALRERNKYRESHRARLEENQAMLESSMDGILCSLGSSRS